MAPEANVGANVGGRVGERMNAELAYSFGAIIRADRASVGMSIFW